MTDLLCHCGSGQTFAACCEPILTGAAPAKTAEALMRSRYSAFVTGNVDHIENSIAPEARTDFNRTHIEEWAKSSEWLGLSVVSTELGGENDEEGYVEFVARFTLGGKDYAHHETGYFRKLDGAWMYIDGNNGPRTVVRQGPKLGRNDPCHCGSGKKYKKCHGA